MLIILCINANKTHTKVTSTRLSEPVCIIIIEIGSRELAAHFFSCSEGLKDIMLYN